MKASFLFRDQWMIMSLFFLFAGFFIPSLDIAIHDTYVVVSGMHVGIAGALLFGTMWVLHRFIRACRTIRLLSAVHLVVNSVLGFGFWMVLSVPVRQETTRFGDYSVYDELSHQPETGPEEWLAILVCVFAVVQLIWLIQVVAHFARARS